MSPKQPNQQSKEESPRSRNPAEGILSDGTLPCVPPGADENREAHTIKRSVSIPSLGSEPNQILARIISGQRELISSVREGLNSGDLICRDVWRSVCKQCDRIPRTALLELTNTVI